MTESQSTGTKRRRSLSIVIPAFNEEQRLPSSLAIVKDYMAKAGWDFSEIIVVDDGSTDRTAEVAERHGVKVLRNEGNRGKGYSVKRGVSAAAGDWVLFTDADLSAPIEELETLWNTAEAAGVECAVGSRALDPSLIGVRQPVYREAMGKIFNWLVRIETGLEFRDTQCGFKLFRASAARRIFPLQRLEGFGFDVEILFIAKQLGCSALEVPVRWNNAAGTKVGLLVGAKAFLDPLKIRWNGLLGRYQPVQGVEAGPGISSIS